MHSHYDLIKFFIPLKFAQFYLSKLLFQLLNFQPLSHNQIFVQFFVGLSKENSSTLTRYFFHRQWEHLVKYRIDKSFIFYYVTIRYGITSQYGLLQIYIAINPSKMKTNAFGGGKDYLANQQCKPYWVYAIQNYC